MPRTGATGRVESGLLKPMNAEGTSLVPTRLAVYSVNESADKYPQAKWVRSKPVNWLTAIAVKGNVLSNIAATERPAS
jgi:hypothetical protein